MLVNPVNRIFRLSDAIIVAGYKYSRLTYSYKSYWPCYDRPKRHLHNQHENASIESSNKILEERKPPWNIMFFGTDEFALESLITLHNEQKSEK